MYSLTLEYSYSMCYFTLLVTAGPDFMITSSSPVDVPPNAVLPGCIAIAIVNDTVVEDSEQFTINWVLGEDYGGRVSLPNIMTTVTITSDGELCVDQRGNTLYIYSHS